MGGFLEKSGSYFPGLAMVFAWPQCGGSGARRRRHAETAAASRDAAPAPAETAARRRPRPPQYGGCSGSSELHIEPFGPRLNQRKTSVCPRGSAGIETTSGNKACCKSWDIDMENWKSYPLRDDVKFTDARIFAPNAA
jgi:hypothetical protein